MDLYRFLEMQQEIAQAPAPPDEAEQAALAAAVDKAMGPYRVGPDDVLVISMSGLESVGRVFTDQTEAAAPWVEARVDHEGNIRLPAVGFVHVAGLELIDVEQVVQDAYVPNVLKDAAVHVRLAEPATAKVLVTGAVTVPGLVPLRHNERNLLFALVGAGGVTQAASGMATLHRLRRPGEVVSLNLTDPEELRAALQLDPLQDGDIVRVHSAEPNTVFVGGLVNAPSPQFYPPGSQINVLQALAASGGLRTDVTPREATLIRRMSDGRDVHVKLNLDRIGKGQDPNIMLAAGDILWVPWSAETRTQDFINKNFFLKFGASVTYQLEGTEDYIHGDNFFRGQGNDLESTFDPFGFLSRNASLQNISSRLP
jgi:polysaccharide export outer membrane protein